ncbi:YLL032C [Zygosaccharomyces parabailii]|nr:YLL032C [Zygosaccharomyces parabailii]CDH14831.1 related to KH domain-containing protein YLL032C [Zygosaccharomyces bailii ISA1307]
MHIYSHFDSSAFIEVPHVFQTGRLWKSTKDRTAAWGSAVWGSNRCIVTGIPKDAKGVTVARQDDQVGVYVIQGVTEVRDAEPLVCTAIPVRGPSSNVDGFLGELKQRFVELANEFDVEIVVTREAVYGASKLAGNFSLYVHMLGLQSRVVPGEIHLWSLIELYHSSRGSGSSLFVECLDLDARSLLPSVVGVDMANIKYVEQAFQTRAYISALTLPMDADSSHESKFRPQVVLCGKVHSLVLAAKDFLANMACRPPQSPVYFRRFTSLSSGKLLYIQKHYHLELNRLMIKYQSLVRVTDTCIEFRSICLPLLEALIKAFTIEVLHRIVEIQITMEDSFRFTEDTIRKIVKDDLIVVEIPSKENQLLVIGTHSHSSRENATTIFQQVATLCPSSSLRQLRAIFEIHMNYEDFISGKKNGKLTRVMETVHCLIKLERFEDDDNMFLTLVADTTPEFIEACNLVLNELPAEESFFIPEIYHRPVIGPGGSVIQATMKKYNVFVQFSNTFFLPQNDLSCTRYDNVVIRCPFKNFSAIPQAKEELTLLAQECSKLRPLALVKLSKGQYHFLLSSSSPPIAQIVASIEKNHKVFINFPSEEPNENYMLEVRGNDNTCLQAAQELINGTFGCETLLKVDQPIVLDHEFFNSIVIPFKYAMGIEVSASSDTIGLVYKKGNGSLNKSLEVLSEYLKYQRRKIVSTESVKNFLMTYADHQESNKNMIDESAVDTISLQQLRINNQPTIPPPLYGRDMQYLQPLEQISKSLNPVQYGYTGR